MAQIVGGFGSSHTPLMSLTTGELWQDYANNADHRNRELVKPPNGRHLTYEELLAEADPSIAAPRGRCDREVGVLTSESPIGTREGSSP